jgi:hypothetical protein
VLPRYSIWKGLSAQLDFTNKLTDLVDTLRFIDRPFVLLSMVQAIIASSTAVRN